MTDTRKPCPKCGHTSGDDWSQCEGSCPIEHSPHYDSKVLRSPGAELLAQVEADPAAWEGLSHEERSAVLNELTRLAREK